ncbi:MAG: hypothetical protein FWH55_14420 [Oscillospiraceae bacterium]|nr:hypothetical protein [Oscillospiraceae bacterium]
MEERQDKENHIAPRYTARNRVEPQKNYVSIFLLGVGKATVAARSSLDSVGDSCCLSVVYEAKKRTTNTSEGNPCDTKIP